MASSSTSSSYQLSFTILVIAAIFVPSALATDFVVGDDKGWTTNFDYQAWTVGKVFHVGDRLVFSYPASVHNVLKVNGTGFQNCEAPLGTEPLTSGNDIIPLATPGRKWYICGVANHCADGKQKLVITVLPQVASPGSSPSSTPSKARKVDVFGQFGRMLMILGILGVVMA